MRELKLDAAVEAGKITQESHPSRVRELKLQQVEFATRKGESHPSRVRELKLDELELEADGTLVAPLPGA